MSTLDPSSLPLAAPASEFQVVRFDREAEGNDRFAVLHNVIVSEIHYNQGAVLPSASFSYILDSVDPESPYPYLWEQLWPQTATSEYAVKPDDELLVFEYVDGERFLVFDGFAAIPQVDQQSRGLSASFTATSVHQRLWDRPVRGAVYRSSADPEAGERVATDLPVRFNPDGKANKTPDGYDVNQGADDAYPVFLDPLTYPYPPTFWTLGDLVRYLFAVHNDGKDPRGNLWVNDPVSPTGETIDDYLKAPTPKNGEFMDLSDASTYTLEPIIIRDFDCSNKPLIEAVAEQIGYYGYRLFLNTREDPNDSGAPVNEVIVFRVDGRDGNAPKELYYPKEGGSLLDGLPDFDSCSLSRDHVNAFNEVMVETREIGYEVSVMLAPGFSISAGDTSTISSWDKAALTASTTTAADRKKYRVFVFDEAGQGHWDFGSSSFIVATPTSLDSVLGKPDDNGVPVYVPRPRPARGNTLFSADGDGKPRKAELAISRWYTGTIPGIYDPSKDGNTATDWQSIADSGWNFTKDGLGVEIAIGDDNPENWKLPKTTVADYAGGVVKVITSMANPTGYDTRFYLRLTCVIDGDRGIDALAAKRDASPMKFAVRRVIESKDHWQKQVIHKNSKYNSSGTDTTARDDTAAATAHAESLRLAHEFPGTGGHVSIPWITHAYGVGDFISKVSGRDIPLDSGAGGPAGEGPRYPAVVGFTWTCQNPQTTILKLDDHRSEPEGANHGWGRMRRV